MKETIKACIDLDAAFNNDNSDERRLFGMYNAYIEREENVLNEITKSTVNPNTRTEQVLIDSTSGQNFEKLMMTSEETKKELLELALRKNRMWANGKRLRVKFIGGDAYLHEKVVYYAKQWEDVANIKFDFISSGNAEIRVAFEPGGSWSYVGTDALNITDQNQPTMNFGWFNHETPDIEFSRTIVHEFGHSLGCVHEHQSPAAAINWNKPVVYDYYRRSQGWDKDKVDHNLFSKLNQSEITNSAFDKSSIMLYPIPKEFTLDGFNVGWNSFLSAEDIDFIKKCYRKP